MSMLCEQPAVAPLQEQIGTEPIKVGAAVKTSTGATKGDIPIGYVGTSVDRSGHYYLPKGEETLPCRLQSAVHPCVGKGPESLHE